MRRVGGRFVLLREIGAGGMSTVYLGRDEVLDRHVAVKILAAGLEDSEVAERFRREGRTAARLSHPNIVQVYDAGEGDLDGREISYIVMEHVSGGDLKALIDERGPLPGREVARVGADLASGLAHAHERGVIHRDVKPQNVLLDEYGYPKLTDFGIARALGTTTTTTTASYLGTASYSSPEQLQGEEITPKSDVYSLGATLYHAAVGEPPFSGTPLEVASQHISKSPPSPRARGARMGEALESTILACLEKDPAARPDAAELTERLLRESAAQAAGARGAGSSGRAPVIGDRRGRGEPPVDTKSLPMRTFRTGGRRRGLIWLAVALVLFAGGMFLAFGGADLLGTSPSGEGVQGGQAASDGEPERGESSGPPPTAAAAEQAVYEMYVAAAENRFEDSWSYLSRDYRQEVGSVEEWTRRYEDLSFIRFSEGPAATVSGGVARVRFTAQESRSDGTRTVSGTWVVITEDGEPRLDRLVRDG
ncbi:MAG: serine/threonine-protein kinase [Actinomycetota bacterium]